MSQRFPNAQAARAHARQAFEAGQTRVAPITELLAQLSWEGLDAWYNEYDLASGRFPPYEGADFQEVDWPSNSIEAD